MPFFDAIDHRSTFGFYAFRDSAREKNVEESSRMFNLSKKIGRCVFPIDIEIKFVVVHSLLSFVSDV